MLRWSFLFLIVAIIAAIFGFTDIAESATMVAQVLFFIFISVWFIMVVSGLALLNRR